MPLNSVLPALRICVVAHLRFPIREPFAGGLEAATHALVAHLCERGHQVTLFAAPGSAPDLPVRLISPAPHLIGDGRPDPSRHDETRTHRAYQDFMVELIRSGDEYDVVHNHSLHYLPLVLADGVPAPMLTTFHTPPFATLESGARLARHHTFTAVSDFTARTWSPIVESTVVCNGVDLERFRPGHGQGSPVWSGRLVPEKAPHEAIDAARRAGLPLRLVGPVSDRDYYRREILPRLGRGIEHLGHLDHRDLSALLGTASVCLVTPAWDEPFGLVVAEAAACGTPVAAYARGALPDLVTQECGRLAAPGDIAGLARAMVAAQRIDRRRVRAHARRHFSVETMLQGYERLYRELATDRQDAA